MLLLCTALKYGHQGMREGQIFDRLQRMTGCIKATNTNNMKEQGQYLTCFRLGRRPKYAECFHPSLRRLKCEGILVQNTIILVDTKLLINSLSDTLLI